MMNEFLADAVRMMEMMDGVDNMEAHVNGWTIEIATRSYRTPVVREIIFSRDLAPEVEEEPELDVISEAEEGTENDLPFC